MNLFTVARIGSADVYREAAFTVARIPRSIQRCSGRSVKCGNDCREHAFFPRHDVRQNNWNAVVPDRKFVVRNLILRLTVQCPLAHLPPMLLFVEVTGTPRRRITSTRAITVRYPVRLYLSQFPCGVKISIAARLE